MDTVYRLHADDLLRRYMIRQRRLIANGLRATKENAATRKKSWQARERQAVLSRAPSSRYLGAHHGLSALKAKEARRHGYCNWKSPPAPC